MQKKIKKNSDSTPLSSPTGSFSVKVTEHAKRRFRERAPHFPVFDRKGIALQAWGSTERSETIRYLESRDRGQIGWWRDFHYRLYQGFVFVFEEVKGVELKEVKLMTLFPHQPPEESITVREIMHSEFDQIY